MAAAAFGVAASAFSVADFGIRLTKTIYDYADSVATSYERMSALGKDVRQTTKTIKELGYVFKEAGAEELLRAEALVAAQETMNDCREIFGKMYVEIGEDQKPDTWSFSWPFRQLNVDVLNARLEKLKSTLLLLTATLQLALSVRQGKATEEKYQTISTLILQEKEAEARYKESLSRHNEEDQTPFVATGNLSSSTPRPQTQTITAEALDQAGSHINNLLQLIESVKESFAGTRTNSLPPHENTELERGYLNTRSQLDRIILKHYKAVSSRTKMERERIERKAASEESRASKIRPEMEEYPRLRMDRESSSKGPRHVAAVDLLRRLTKVFDEE
ncbi:uncharacterized protein J3D65DRAFT_636690 [Phyllosticta citribraziliensis]|uniref:Fungal N-terminal domain-containing protein n=1 Tax=Phyllosticta citribraziliensis TaxID=989973 RepID=A0ABR1LCN6_9PEZI